MIPAINNILTGVAHGDYTVSTAEQWVQSLMENVATVTEDEVRDEATKHLFASMGIALVLGIAIGIFAHIFLG